MKGIDQIACQKFAGVFAWPTVLLATLTLFFFLAGIFLGAFEKIPLALVFFNSLFWSYLAFTPLHEAAHKNIVGRFKKFSWLENFIGYLMGGILLGPYPCFSFIHLSHHAHTNQNKSDPDYWVHSQSKILVVLKCMTILPHYYVWFFSQKKRAAKKLFWPTILVFLLNLILACVLMALTSFQFFFFAWMLPSFLANGMLAFVLDYLPHMPHKEISRHKNTNLVLGNFYHVVSMAHSLHMIHHLWPKIPFYNYRMVYKEFGDELRKRGIPVFASFRDLWRNGL